MIQKSKLVENALEITSTGHKVRILAKGDRLYFQHPILFPLAG